MLAYLGGGAHGGCLSPVVVGVVVVMVGARRRPWVMGTCGAWWWWWVFTIIGGGRWWWIVVVGSWRHECHCPAGDERLSPVVVRMVVLMGARGRPWVVGACGPLWWRVTIIGGESDVA